MHRSREQYPNLNLSARGEQRHGDVRPRDRIPRLLAVDQVGGQEHLG
jgi:hypothetical protein